MSQLGAQTHEAVVAFTGALSFIAFCPSHIPLPLMAAPVHLTWWESYFPVCPCKVPHSLLVAQFVIHSDL